MIRSNDLGPLSKSIFPFLNRLVVFHRNLCADGILGIGGAHDFLRNIFFFRLTEETEGLEFTPVESKDGHRICRVDQPAIFDLERDRRLAAIGGDLD